MHARPCAADSALLDDLALSGAFPDVVWQRQRAPQPAAVVAPKMAATRTRGKCAKKKTLKTLTFPLHAPSGTIRQALFPTGPGSYPSPTMALHNSPPRDCRQQRLRKDDRKWTDTEPQTLDNKRRETSWNTSFPAEYAKSNPYQDFQHTLAYQEQLDRLQQQQQQHQYDGPSVGRAASPGHYGDPARLNGTDRGIRTAADDDSGSCPQTIERLVLLKEVAMREGLLKRLTSLVASAAHTPDFGDERGNELLHLLLKLRDASVQVLQAIANWHGSLRFGPRAFMVDDTNYAVKMIADLNFLAKTKSLAQVLGVSPARMKQNPFMMPAPIPERDFVAIETLPWTKTQRTFSTDPVERVADAERYLVWCVFHLGDPIAEAPSASGQSGTSSPTTHYRHNPHDAPNAETSASTWQMRAEKQLQVLSMPLEAPMGQTHLMDSSSMMKRKGYLPSLSLSPAKTLGDLTGTTHARISVGAHQQPVPRRLHAVMHVRAVWNGVAFTTSSSELEALGALASPPHHMVALVAASVLILLSPSDRIPKDLSWPSCRKMLLRGAALVDRMDGFDVGAVPPFKLQALVPFLQNEHFQPKFLSEFSRPAGALCAWVFAALAAAQNQEITAMSTSRSDVDRLDLLGELEIEDGFEASQCDDGTPEPVAPARKPRSAKRVTIGNAEVLFINENEPVAGGSLSSSSTPRPASRSEMPPVARNKSSVLLRTSPWTFHGVTYFVSFFLEPTETALAIKLYEPMSSVESQIFVTDEDLEADFGAHASELFDARDFRPLCDLILSRLDDMMDGSKLSARQQQQPPRVHQSACDAAADDSDASECRGGGLHHPVLDEYAAAIDLLEFENKWRDDNDELGLNERDDGYDERDGASDDVEESVLRIQCAARQRFARDKVHHVRVEQASEREQLRDESAVRIQSVARQTLAKKEVAHRRIANRVPTGIPSDEMLLRAERNGRSRLAASIDDDGDGEDDDNSEAQQVDEDRERGGEALLPPEGHFGSEVSEPVESGIGSDVAAVVVSARADRPETSMSYGSEQFEDDDVEEA